jgi:hypothetical protein
VRLWEQVVLVVTELLLDQMARALSSADLQLLAVVAAVRHQIQLQELIHP